MRALGGFLLSSWKHLQASCKHLQSSWKDLEASCKHFESSWEDLEASWAHLEGSWRLPESSWRFFIIKIHCHDKPTSKHVKPTIKKMRTSYAKPGLLLKVKKVAKTSSEKSQVKKKPKKLVETSSETFQDPCRRCSASRGYVEKCEESNGFRPPKGLLLRLVRIAVFRTAAAAHRTSQAKRPFFV